MDLATGGTFFHQSAIANAIKFMRESHEQPTTIGNISSANQASYLQPTFSSQERIFVNEDHREGANRSGQQPQQNSTASDKMASGNSGLLSPRSNQAKQKLLRDLTRQNREIAKHVRQYARRQ